MIILLNTLTREGFEINQKSARVHRLRKRIFSWANFLSPYFGRLGTEYRLAMVTLTYEHIEDWRKNHIRDYMKGLKRKLKGNLLAYAWAAELQERGAVHYHVEILVKRGTAIPYPDQSGMWNQGSSSVKTCRSPFYICEYVSKEYQKMGKFPKGLRMFAVYICKDALTEVERWYYRHRALPKWLSEEVMAIGFEGARGRLPRRLKGGGWNLGSRTFKSPYVVLMM